MYFPYTILRDIWHIKYKINTRSARHEYNTFIYSKIKYGMEIYGSCSSIDFGKNQITQNKSIKLLLRLRQMMPTNGLHINLDILKYSKSMTIMSSALWMKSFPGDRLIHLRITVFGNQCSINVLRRGCWNMTCVLVHIQCMMDADINMY